MNLPISKPPLNYQELDYLLDRAKAKVFMSKNSGFLGSVMSGLNFFWDEGIGTAAIRGITLVYNPYFFLKQTPEGRVTTLKHEVWHVGYLDPIRCGSRDPRIWNYACDIRINNNLHNEGDTMDPKDLGLNPWLDHQYDGMSPEDIYDAIYPIGVDQLVINYGETEDDIIDPEEEDEVIGFPGKVDKWTVLNNVIAATQAAKMGAGSGASGIPGEVETVLQRFLSPKLPWNQILFNFFNEKSNQDYSMRKPNRRYADIYMPSLVEESGGLDHLLFGGDVSGSVNDAEFTRYTSEVKYIKDHFDPKLLTFFQFDTIIQSMRTWDETEPFDEVIRKGYGGTDLRCVRELILKIRPSAVVILSDLCCEPMVPLGNEFQVPIIWVAVNNASARVNEGKLIFMRE